MPSIILRGCTATPFGSYLKALGVLRLVSEQADSEARGWWEGDAFAMQCNLSEPELLDFFLERYDPTPIVAPWNGGSGFYPKDNKEGMDAIAATTGARFESYRDAIATCRGFAEVQAGKQKDEDERRSAILRRCRNELSDRAVEWLDAAVGIAANGERSFAPVLGTGGNEGRLDYTNNFMSRIKALLIAPDRNTPVRGLLNGALFGVASSGLQPGAAGQYDPGRAGGANQGPGIEHEAPTNPWDLILTLEGAVAWASGLYRRHGVQYGSFLCSPFTVRATKIGYGSASKDDEARAELWAPIWSNPVRYAELRALLREGRASIEGRPAKNTLEFAEAAASLCVDRGINRFVRYILLKRRGDSYVALPAGTLPVRAGDKVHRTKADFVRKLHAMIETLPDSSRSAEDLRRGVDSAIFDALLKPGWQGMREMMAALGRMLCRVATRTDIRLPTGVLEAGPWLDACGFEDCPEVRIAAAIASIWTPEIGSITENLSRAGEKFAWTGIDLPVRLMSVLDRRILMANAAEHRENPLGGACELHPGDATLFIEGTTDNDLLEDLLFAFVTLNWKGFETRAYRTADVSPVYATLKCLFLPGEVERGSEVKRLSADRRVLSLLAAGSVEDAADIAVHRLRVAGLRPLDVRYSGGVDGRRLAASLLIPVWKSTLLNSGILREEEFEAHA